MEVYTKLIRSREIIRIFIQMCEQCVLKKIRSETTKLVVRPITSTDFNFRKTDRITEQLSNRLIKLYSEVIQK